MTQATAPYCQIKETLRKLETLELQLKKSFGITLDEAILLCCLSERCKCQGNIASDTGLTPTQASRLLSKLETKGFVSRSIGPQDKRQMVFTLTPDGTKLLETITPLGTEFLKL